MIMRKTLNSEGRKRNSNIMKKSFKRKKRKRKRKILFVSWKL